MSAPSIKRFADRGFLHRIYRGVYSLGHRALQTRGKLAAALLYSGPGAVLSGLTGAWWFEVVPAVPKLIHVATPRRVAPVAGLLITRADIPRTSHRGLPTCTIERVLIDVAPSLPEKRLRKAVSEALYRRLTTVEAIEAELGPGRTGSTAVRAALERHRDGIQRSRSELEEAFLLICERARVQTPLVNQNVAGFEVDGYWPDARLAVEIDGPGHAEIARLTVDRTREMALRQAGIDLIRYSPRQIAEEAKAVADEIARELAGRRSVSEL